MEIELPPALDLSLLPKTGRIVIVGKRNCGKSVAIDHLLTALGSPVVVAVSAADRCNRFYRDPTRSPPIHVYDEWTEFVQNSLLHRQEVADHWKDSIAAVKEVMLPYIRIAPLVNMIADYLPVSKHMVLVLEDDTFINRRVFSEPKTRWLLENPRSHGMLQIHAVQYHLDLPKSLQMRTDLVFFCSRRCHQCAKRDIRAMVANFQDFLHLFRLVTDNYGFLVLDTGSGICYRWKAQLAPRAPAEHRLLHDPMRTFLNFEFQPEFEEEEETVTFDWSTGFEKPWRLIR